MIIFLILGFFELFVKTYPGYLILPPVAFGSQGFGPHAPVTKDFLPKGKTSSQSAIFPVSSAISKKKQILVMEKGESMLLLSPSFERVWLSQGGVVSVREEGRGLRLQAKKLGEVLLSIGSRLYLVQVLSPENKQHFLALKQLLSHRMGLEVRFVQDRLRVQGAVYRTQDFKDLSQLARDQKISYLFEATVSEQLRPAIKDYILNQVKNPLFVQPVLSWQKPLTAFLPDDLKLMDFYKTGLKPFGLILKKDPSLLPAAPLIRLKILLVESGANHSFQTHINWGEKVINQLLSGDLFKSIFSEFKAMENKGQARILSRTTLLSESGKKSYFHSGGSVPVPQFNPENGTQSVKWKPYGIELNFLATADRNNKIHIQTRAEISEVDHAYSAHSAPALKSHSITSSLTMQAGQSLLLSQMLRQQKGKSYSAPSALFRLPLAGPVLSFKGRIKQNTRLSIFITADFPASRPQSGLKSTRLSPIDRG